MQVNKSILVCRCSSFDNSVVVAQVVACPPDKQIIVN